MKKLFAMLLALCLMCGAVSAFAEAAETQEAKIGNVTFQIPAGMEMTRMTNNDRQYESETCSIALVSWEMDAEMVQYMVDEMKSKGSSFSFQQSAVLFGEIVGGMGQDTAIQVAVMAVPEDIGMLNGEPVMSGKEIFKSSISFYAQAYRDNYFSVFVRSEVLSPEEIEQIGKDIMRSVRIDGVTEEQMAADAEAARIAAEQAAMQKYVVITNSSANIRSGPGGDYDKVTTARQGDTFPLIGEDGNWYIIDVNGRTGYVTKGLSKIK